MSRPAECMQCGRIYTHTPERCRSCGGVIFKNPRLA